MNMTWKHFHKPAALIQVLAAAACITVASCSRDAGRTGGKSMNEITSVEIHKSERRMILYSGDVAVRGFDVGLGSSPVGHKQERGDGRTPVGTYIIDRQNPNSRFHLSLGISYPNEVDRQVAEILGKDPGDNIFIHGEPNNFRRRPGRDWTDGCIAVTNREMDYIFRTVKVGTPVQIYH